MTRMALEGSLMAMLSYFLCRARFKVKISNETFCLACRVVRAN